MVGSLDTRSLIWGMSARSVSSARAFLVYRGEHSSWFQKSFVLHAMAKGAQ